jgi:hypothetical protein
VRRMYPLGGREARKWRIGGAYNSCCGTYCES